MEVNLGIGSFLDREDAISNVYTALNIAIV